MLHRIIGTISVFAPLVPILSGLTKRTLLWWYVLVAFGSDILLNYIIHDQCLRLTIVTIFLLVEFVFISIFYYNRLQYGRFFFLVPLLFGGLYASYSIARGPCVFEGFAAAILLCPAYLLYATRGLYILMNERKELYIGQSSFFWANVAIITYFSGNFFLFLFLDYMSAEKRLDLVSALWVFHDTLNIFMQIFLAISFYMAARHKQ